MSSHQFDSRPNPNLTSFGSPILRLSTGILIGALWGRFFGWALFDPKSGMWVAGMFMFGLLGFVVGSSKAFWIYCGTLCLATFGLHSGWAVANILFGDHLGAEGTLIAMSGAILGWRLGLRKGILKNAAAQGALIGAVHFGFVLGGFLYLAFSLILNFDVKHDYSIMIQTIFVFTVGIPGAIIGWLSGRELVKDL